MRQGTPLTMGLSRPLSKVIQGATPLFGATLVPEPRRLLDEVYQSGVDAFDSGLVYADEGGTCDGRLGAWVADRGLREAVTLIGKGCHPGPPDWTASRVRPEAVATDVAVTLDRMGIERLDLWLFHRDDPSVPITELVDAAQDQVASGTIDAWGVSNWSTARLRQALDAANVSPPIATSSQFSLVDQLAEPWPGVTTLTGFERAAERASLIETGITVMAWSPLAGGFLTTSHQPGSKTDPETTRCYDSLNNRRRRDNSQELAALRGCSLEQVAIAYVANSPMRAHAVCAARSGPEATANIEAATMELTAEERRWLEQGDRHHGA